MLNVSQHNIQCEIITYAGLPIILIYVVVLAGVKMETGQDEAPKMLDPVKLKALKIKTGVVKRYTKEKQSYEKEASMQRTKIEKFKAEGKDDHFIRQQEGCLKESEMMVPEVQRQLLVRIEYL